MIRHRRFGIALLGLSLFVGFTAPAKAADLDPYLPKDTEAVLIFNFKQLLDSKLIKNQVGVDTLKGVLEGQPQAKKILDGMGIDPFKNLNHLVFAQPAKAADEQGLIILRGQFDVEKMRKFASKMAADKESGVEELSVTDLKKNKHTIYKMEVPDVEAPLYLGIASKDVVLGAFSKDYLLDGLQVQATKKAELKSTTFSKAMGDLNQKQTIAMAMTGGILNEAFKQAGNQGVPIPESVTDVFKDLEAFRGGITVDDGIGLKFNMVAKTAKQAQAIDAKVTDGLKQAKAFLTFLAMQNPQLQIALDFVNKLKTTTSENVVTIGGGFSAEELKKLIPQDQ